MGEGNQAAATLTGQAIDTFDPDLVLLVGVAGSLVDSVQLGDVVAATRLDAYHGGKQVATRFMARPVTWPAAWQLDQAARHVRRERRWLARLGEPPAQLAEVLAARPPQVHLKPILAGEVVVDSRESRLYRFLREHYNDAVAVEMEGAGLAMAAHASGAVPTMVVRGISDLAGGGKAASDAAGWQEQAAAHAAAFAVQLLITLDPKAFSQAPREARESPNPVVHPHPEKGRPTRPFWDPGTGQCRGIEGSPVIPGEWQVSAPRDLDAGRVVRPGQVVTLGLRKKYGQQHEMYWVSATVFAPDGTSTQIERVLHGDEWAQVNYPTDFAGAPLSYPPGPYTVLWEVAEGFLACDGFLVEDRTTFGAAAIQVRVSRESPGGGLADRLVQGPSSGRGAANADDSTGQTGDLMSGRRQVDLFRVVVASPGDVQAERDALGRVIEELNRNLAADHGVRIELLRWETDAYPGFHSDGPQGLIDSVLRVEDCDLLVGIFWKRFGTSTADADSGTEHEFRLAYEAWKRGGSPQIMMYFKERAALPKSKPEIDQWGRVLQFREKFPKEGLWWPYKDQVGFERLVRSHLTALFRRRLSSSTRLAAEPPTRDDGAAATPVEDHGGLAKVTIELPRDGQRESHRVPMAGTVHHLPRGMQLWIVKEPRPRNYHPDRESEGRSIRVDGTKWSGTAFIGNERPGADNGQSFTIHIVQVSNEGARRFDAYLDKAPEAGWPGLRTLYGGVILQTVHVIRDDG